MFFFFRELLKKSYTFVMRKIKLFKKTIIFILCALPAGLAVADVSSDRIDTYKSNKLLPSEVQIATINSVSSEATGVVVFSMDTLSWKSYNNVSDAFISKYMDWTKEDFEAFFANSDNSSEFEYAWKFLSQTGNDHLQGATISDEDALALLQNQFNTLVNQYRFALFPAFPCEGLDFTGLMLAGIDFSNCSGITGNQLASAMFISTCTFKDVDFNGADISGINAQRLDISACTGLTAEQLSSVKSIYEWKLPAMDLTNVNLTGIDAAEADFSKCTGLTADQLMATSDFFWS